MEENLSDHMGHKLKRKEEEKEKEKEDEDHADHQC